MTEFSQWVAQHQVNFNKALISQIHQAIPKHQNQLHDAIIYVSTKTGKVIRPLLCFATAAVFNAPSIIVQPLAIGLELIHTYSLIHDDLPAMDNDALRRGHPTCHIKYDEATAILVGDALQSMAFQVIGECNLPDAIKVKAIIILAKAAGVAGMAGGQMLNMKATNQSQALSTLAELDHLHSLKTGAIIEAGILMSALACPNYETAFEPTLKEFAQNIGVAFQIQDDILDVIGNTHDLGKTAGSDASLNKLTYPALLGLQQSQERLQELHQKATRSLQQIPKDTTRLEELAAFIIHRRF